MAGGRPCGRLASWAVTAAFAALVALAFYLSESGAMQAVRDEMTLRRGGTPDSPAFRFETIENPQ